jgi:hypothetical protein
MEAGGDNKALAKFETRTDLQAFGSNALLLFALQLRWGMTDIEGVAAEALTDASNDKKCDLVYVDRENGRVVVGQGYMSSKTDLTAAPSSKASDLNTAVTWLLSGDLDGLPAVLKSAAEEVRDAIEQDEIREFHIWYVHNAPESANVADELKQAVTTADALLHTHFSEAQVEVTAMEIGVSELDRLYRRTEATIAVTDELKVTVPGGFESGGQGWSAYTTSVPGVWLREQWQKYGEDLMSPNVRAYLGIVRSERNINNGIKTTAKETPDRFWIYNNGITILVHDYAVAEQDGTGEYEITLKGAGIVNGAQTTGSISTLADEDAPDLESTQVLTRFVRTEDPEVLGDVIKFNNTQNKVEAADFRSKDEVQERLRREFEEIPDADYKGARRGGIQDAIERPANRLSDRAVAQALAGFQLAPNLAYNETRRIWEENGVYSRFFSERITARHVIFVFSLLRALETTKRRVNEIPEGERTEAQTRHVQFFRGRGSTITMLSAISSSIELFLDRQVPDRAVLRFTDNCSPADAANYWQPIIDVVLSFSGTLVEATDLGLKKQENVQEALRRFQEMVEATAEANRERYEEFSAKVELAD